MKLLRTVSLIALAVALVGLLAGDAQAAVLDSVRVVTPDSGRVRGIDSLITVEAFFRTTSADSNVQVLFWLADKTATTGLKTEVADTTKNSAALTTSVLDSVRWSQGDTTLTNPGTLNAQATGFVAAKRKLYKAPANILGDADTVIVDNGPAISAGVSWKVTWRYKVHASVDEVNDVTAYASVWDPNGSGRGFTAPQAAKRGWATKVDGDRPVPAADLDLFPPAAYGASTVAGFAGSTSQSVLGIGDTVKVKYDLGSQGDAIILQGGIKVSSQFKYGSTATAIDLGSIRSKIDSVWVVIAAGQFVDISASSTSGQVELFLQEISSGNLGSGSKDDVVPIGVTEAAAFVIDATLPSIDGAATGDTLLPVSTDSISGGGKGQSAPRASSITFADDLNPVTYYLKEALKKLTITFDGATDYVFTIEQSPSLASSQPLSAAETRYLDLAPQSATMDSTYAVWGTSSLATFTKAAAGRPATGLYTVTAVGTDAAGNVGGTTTRTNVYVDVTPIVFAKLFPAKSAFGLESASRLDTIEEVTSRVQFALSEPADSALITYKVISGADTSATGMRTRKLSGTELARTSYEAYTVPGMMDKSTYALTVLARDLVGNYAMTGPDTFRYDTSFTVPVIKRFVVAVNTAKKGIAAAKQNTAGDTVIVNLTADATLDGTRDAVTYKSPTIFKIGGADGVTISGTGVTDLGNGRATLNADDWAAGKRFISIKDTVGYDSLAISIVDSTSAGSPYAGALDSLVVFKPAAYSKIIVSAPATVSAGQEFTVNVRLSDTYNNARVDDDRFVSIAANKLGVEIPTGPVWIDNGVGSFVAKANAAMSGLTFRVVDMVQLTGTATPTLQGISAAVTVGGAAVAAIDAPDTLVAEDYPGDQGGFILLTFPLSSDHSTLTGYRIYREMAVNYGLVGGVLTELATPDSVLMPWGRVDAVPGETVGRVIVATLDNTASVWAIAAERGNATSGKEAFDAAAVVATPYELMASTMVASQKAALQPNTPVFATLTPEALAYIEKGVAPSFKATDVALSAQVRTAAPVRSIDNIAPEAVTYLRAMDTPADAGSSVSVVWARSASDQMLPRFVGSAVSNGAVSDAVAGVNGYNVYRKVGTGEYTLVGTAGAGETSFADLTALNGVRYTYKIQPYDQDNEAASALERTAMAIRNSAVDIQGKPVYGLFGMDNRVGFDDFFVFADNFGLTAGDDTFEAAFDLAQNARVDFEDFFVFADNFGRSIEAAGKTIPTMAGLNTDARLSLDAGAQLPRVGEEVSVNVSLADFVELKGYGFNVNYDATKLEFVKVDVAENLLGESELAAPRVLSQQDGQVAIAAYGQTATEGNMALNLVFRTKAEIENTLIEVTESEVRDGNYAVNQIALPAPVQIQTRPETYALGNNYPNPFNPATTIKYALPEAGLVKLEVYNVVGQVVRTLVSEQQNAGRYAIQWNASDNSGYSLSSGIYFYRLQAGDNFLEVKKMLLLK